MFIENDSFAKLITLLNTKAYNAEAMVLSLAKTHPELFVHLAEESIPRSVPVPGWLNDTVSLAVAGDIVGAIKLFRQKTGSGLKEAKDVIDNLRDYTYDKYGIGSYVNTQYNVQPDYIGLYNEMMKIIDQRYKK